MVGGWAGTCKVPAFVGALEPMGAVEDESLLAAFLRTVKVGDVLMGTVAEIARSRTTVLLDAFAGNPVGVIGALDLSWRSSRRFTAAIVEVGGRVAAEVIAVDLRERLVWLSRSATENPQLWAYLKALRPRQRLSGTVAAIERFGVFVELDDGPNHPVLPGVGFITMPELSWHRFEDPPLRHLPRRSPPIAARRPARPVGDEVTVTIIEIDPLRRRLALSRRQEDLGPPADQTWESVRPRRLILLPAAIYSWWSHKASRPPTGAALVRSARPRADVRPG